MNSFVKNNSLLLNINPLNINPLNLVLVYDTSKEPANNTVSVPLNGTVNCTIDWGDGFSDSYTTTGFKTHTYASAGVYVVQISGTMTSLSYGTGASSTNNKLKLVRCLSFGNVGLTSLASAFRNCPNLIECPESLPTTSNVTTLADCFADCSSFNDERIGSWNTATVTNMNDMFSRAVSFNQPIGSWNTAAVSSMNSTFFAAIAFNQNIGSWNTGAVTTMSSMFRGATSFNQNIGSWNTAAVTNMSTMFNGATSFSQDISGWDIRRVTTMSTMFTGSIWGTANYDAALEHWADLADTDLKSQAITEFATLNAGTQTRVTSNNHGMVLGSRVSISGTTNYNGDYNVTGVSANTFNIGIAFVSNDATGTMKHRRSRNVVAGFGSNKYSAGIPTTKRTVLTDTYLWTITDGGQL